MKRYRNIVIWVILVVLVFGFIYYFRLDPVTKNNLNDLIKNFSRKNISYNNYLYHILITLLNLFLPIFIGPIVSTISILFEIFTIGFSMATFLTNHYLLGFFYAIFSNLIIRFPFLFLSGIVAKKNILITKEFVGKYIFKKRHYHYNIRRIIKQNIIISMMIIAYEIILKLFYVKIINCFKFLI